jgi:hypothetical protein
LPDGRVLIVGGERGGYGRTTVAEVWDPTTASFGPAGSPIVKGLRDHTATLLPEGRVLIVGGDSGYNDEYAVYASTEIWDPTTTSFGPAGSLAEARRSHTATLLSDGNVLVVGGYDGLDETLASAEVWDPSAG